MSIVGDGGYPSTNTGTFLNGTWTASNNFVTSNVVRNATNGVHVTGVNAINTIIDTTDTDSTVTTQFVDSGVGTKWKAVNDSGWRFGSGNILFPNGSSGAGEIVWDSGSLMTANAANMIIQNNAPGNLLLESLGVGGCIYFFIPGPTSAGDINCSNVGQWTFPSPIVTPGWTSNGTKPTGNTGTCSTGVTVAGGATAGTWTSTAICALAGTIILTGMPTTPTGYACFMADRTTAGVTVEETATSATSVTFTVRALPTGSVATVANDILQYSCTGY